MKLLCISGSPRKKGNSQTVIDEFIKTAENKEYEISYYQLNNLSYKGCQGCMACKIGGKEKCVINDDLTEVLNKAEEADVILLVSPVYIGDITSQAKGFIDRLYAFLKPDFHSSEDKTRLKGGKKFVLGLVQGSPVKEQFNDIYPRYSFFLKWFFEKIYLVRECGCISRYAIEKNTQKLDNIRKAAENIL